MSYKPYVITCPNCGTSVTLLFPEDTCVKELKCLDCDTVFSNPVYLSQKKEKQNP